MENNKEVMNIPDHQEQHHAKAPPPQEYLSTGAENPLQPLQPQQLPAGGAMEGVGESKENLETKEDSICDPERCCCWVPGCIQTVLVFENYEESCCTNVCLTIYLCMGLVICCCLNGCRDSFY